MNQKNKSNSDYTIKFILINPLKQDLTWIYFDKIISETHWYREKKKKERKKKKREKRRKKKNWRVIIL